MNLLGLSCLSLNNVDTITTNSKFQSWGCPVRCITWSHPVLLPWAGWPRRWLLTHARPRTTWRPRAAHRIHRRNNHRSRAPHLSACLDCLGPGMLYAHVRVHKRTKILTQDTQSHSLTQPPFKQISIFMHAFFFFLVCSNDNQHH